MKLNCLDRRILRMIRDDYPIPYAQDTEEAIAVGERPLPSADLLRQRLGTQIQSIDDSLDKLVAYQCIVRVYLLSASEFRDQWAAGRRVRRIIISPPHGVNAFQITPISLSVLANQCRERFNRILIAWSTKLVDHFLPILAAFLVGVLMSSLFGLDIRELLSPQQ